jgi:hypothetical protein
MDINKMETQGIDPTLRGIQSKDISGGASVDPVKKQGISSQSKLAQGVSQKVDTTIISNVSRDEEILRELIKNPQTPSYIKDPGIMYLWEPQLGWENLPSKILSESEIKDQIIRKQVAQGVLRNLVVSGILQDPYMSDSDLAKKLKDTYTVWQSYIDNPKVDKQWQVTQEDVDLIKQYKDVLHAEVTSGDLVGAQVIAGRITVDTDENGKPVPKAQELIDILAQKNKRLESYFPAMGIQAGAIERRMLVN